LKIQIYFFKKTHYAFRPISRRSACEK